MTYTEKMLEAERMSLLSGETQADWYVIMTSTGVGSDDD